MRIALLSIGLLLAGAIPAQQTPRSLLWRIQGPGTEGVSYLYGTVHSRDARAFRFNDSLDIAFASCQRVVGELDHRTVRQASLTMMSAMMMPAGQGLDDLYPRRKDLEKVRAVIKEELGPMAALAWTMRPFWLMAMLAEQAMRKDSLLVLDDHLQQRALAEARTVDGLETVEEQMRAVEGIPLKEQAAMLLDMARHDLHRQRMDRMLDAYASQDLDRVMREASEGGLPTSISKGLLEDRNRVMVARMAELMREGTPTFFAVGAAHLPGPGGIIAMLRAEGFTVRAVAPVVSD